MEARLISRREDEEVERSSPEAAVGSSGAGSTLRHRYVLKPVDAKARLALSVDPSDR